MASMHEITQTCPICTTTALRHVHCSNASCTYVVTTCPRCDREQVVRAFMADHEKDCTHRLDASSVPQAPAAFRVPRRNAA